MENIIIVNKLIKLKGDLFKSQQEKELISRALKTVLNLEKNITFLEDEIHSIESIHGKIADHPLVSELGNIPPCKNKKD